MLLVGGRCLSSRACTYSFTNLFRRCSLLFCRNLIHLVTSSSPIFSRSPSKIGFGLPLSNVFGVNTGCSNSSPCQHNGLLFMQISMSNRTSSNSSQLSRLRSITSDRHLFIMPIRRSKKPPHQGARVKLNFHLRFSIPMKFARLWSLLMRDFQ